jgi:signal peptidase II
MIWLEPLSAAVLVLIADQVSKALIMSRGMSRPSARERPFIFVHRVINRHALLASIDSRTALLTAWAATVAIAALALCSGLLAGGTLGAVGIGAAVGGATGNLLDQLRRGGIVDFIAIGPWPTFNLADAAITLGAGLMLLSMR